MLQLVITRLANHGASLKSYCVTITIALCGFSVTLRQPGLALFSLMPITIFAILDAQYLPNERGYRSLFNRVRLEDWGELTKFDMNVGSVVRGSFFSAIGSWSIVTFYLPLGVSVIIVSIVEGYSNGRFF